MLDGPGYELDTFDSFIQSEDEIIFKTSGDLEPKATSYGTITAWALDRANNRTLVMIAPATDARIRSPQDYALIVMPRFLLVTPEYCVGQEIDLVEDKQSATFPVLGLIVSERNVDVNENGEPFYAYRFAVKTHNDQALTEKEVDSLSGANVSLEWS